MLPYFANMNPMQCRAARAILNWSVANLVAASKVSRGTIASFEREERTPTTANLAAIRRALEEAGVEFPDEWTVRLRENSRKT